MNARGHHRVAARVVEALGERAPQTWWSLPEVTAAARLARGEYFREHLGPWVRRRLTGTSSGDGRAAKFPGWIDVTPHEAAAG
jgi:hypothetical protein